MGEHLETNSSREEKYTVPDWSRLEDNMVKIEQSLDRCQNDGEPSTDKACLRSAKDDWDDQLDVVYQSLMSDLNPATAKSLRDSERQWIKFQNEEETAIDTLLGKPGGNDVAAERARMELKRTRAEELRVPVSGYDVPDLGYPTADCLSRATDSRSTNACYINRLNIAEGNMKGTYELLLSKLNPSERATLISSQVEWRDFRDQENNYLHKLFRQRGAYVPAERIAAQVQITEDRTKQFDFYLRNR